MKNKIVLILFVICYFNSFSQNHKYVDSLNKCLKKSTIDTQKVNIFNLLSLEYDGNNSHKALSYAEQALLFAENIQYLKGKSVALNNMGNAYNTMGNYEKSIFYYNELYELSVVLKDSDAMSTALGNLGNSEFRIGNFDESLKWYIKSLKISDALKDKEQQGNSINKIGQIYEYKQSYDKALENYSKALKLFRELGDSIGCAKPITDMGNVYARTGDFESAKIQYEQALKIYVKFNNQDGINSCLNNLGIVYYESGEKKKSLGAFQEALKISQKIGDKSSIANALINIANFYEREMDLKTALKYLNEALIIGKEVNDKSCVRDCYYLIAEVNGLLGNYDMAYEYHKYYSEIKDSIMDQESSLLIEQLQEQYQSEKKQSEIEMLNKDKRIQETEIQSQTRQKYAYLIGFSLMLILVIVVLYSYRKIRQQKKVIENKNEALFQQNEEIRTQKDEIEAQRDEIEAQRDLVTIQKEEIEEIHQELTDSIKYAQKIQRAVLPSEKDADDILGEHFILFKPLHLVSGDFYWFARKDNLILLAVADCTGHGVPGGFMSMLGISFLNEIMSSKNIYSASQVLDEMRRYVIDSLQQSVINTGDTSAYRNEIRMKDGMDMTFVVIDKNKLEMQYSGANNSVYIVTASDDSIESAGNSQWVTYSGHGVNKLIEIKGDKMPVAIHERMEPFVNKIIPLRQGDVVYLLSDGYVDQFGGPKGRKFMSKQFRELLLNNSEVSLADQRNLFDESLEYWKNGFDTKFKQTDDITLVGIRI